MILGKWRLPGNRQSQDQRQAEGKPDRSPVLAGAKLSADLRLFIHRNHFSKTKPPFQPFPWISSRP